MTASDLPDSSQPEESNPLLLTSTNDENGSGASAVDGAALRRNESHGEHTFPKKKKHVLSEIFNTGDHGETYDNVPKERRQLGQWSPVTT